MVELEGQRVVNQRITNFSVVACSLDPGGMEEWDRTVEGGFTARRLPSPPAAVVYAGTRRAAGVFAQQEVS